MIPISERKRIVVKVGTSTLTHRTGRLNIRRVGAARQDTCRSAKCRARGDLGVQRCDWSWYG